MSIKTLELQIEKKKIDRESKIDMMKLKEDFRKREHERNLEKIKAEKELEELKQKNFLTRRNLFGEQDIKELGVTAK